MRGGKKGSKGRDKRGGPEKNSVKRNGYRGSKGNRKGSFEKKKAIKTSAKQTYCFNRYRDKNRTEEENVKKQKLEEKIAEQYETSDSEEEVANPLDQLLSTFKTDGKLKKNVAVDSSDESSVSEDENVDDVGDKMDESDISGEEEEDVDEEEDEDEIAVDDNAALSEDADMADDSENSADDASVDENEHEEDMESEDETEIVEEAIEDIEEDAETEKDDEKLISDDAFTKHLRDDLHDSLLHSVSNKPQIISSKQLSWPVLGRLVVQIPKSDQELDKSELKTKVSVLEEKVYAKQGSVPEKITQVDWEKLNIKQQIQSNLVSANKTNLVRKELDLVEKLTPLQKEMFSVINNYQDFYYPERSFLNCDEIRYVYCLHAVNHLLKTRTKILHHNSRLTKNGRGCDVPEEFRDQGLVRPKVIIVVPFRDSAYKIINTLIEILVPGDSSQVINKNRFEADFTGGELLMPKKNAKPEDYELLFAGNTDDTFRIGLTITKKSLKLYTDFYSSDLIIASPLGLRVIVGAEGEDERDFDFLASAELLILDQTEIFLMQNWDHLLHVIDNFHMQPKKTHGTDFSRLRSWAVNGWTKYYRQTLLFSSVSLPEINSLFNRKCFNYAGKVRVHNPIDVGSIREVAVQIPQVFRRIAATDPVSAIDTRFDYFVKEILPQYKDSIMAHTMILVPSYFDYVRIRNYFKKEDVSFVQICEYSKDAKIARARDMFFHTDAPFLLYSERFHFFRRMRIKGIRHIIFYQPPVFPHFYSELCNLMQEGNQNKFGGSESNMTVTVLYTKYDLQQLSALVGSDRTSKMAQSERNVHMFMTGE